MSYSLFKVGKVWHYRFHIGGKARQRSTRETQKRSAEAVAEAAYEDAKEQARGRRLAPILADLVDDWVRIHEPVLSSAHVGGVKTFRELHLYSLEKERICDITTEKVENARNEYLREHAPSSANLWLKHLKLVMMWAIRRKMLTAMPWRVQLLKVQAKPKPVLPVAVARQWIEAVDELTKPDPSVATAIRMMLGLGLREIEAAGAEWGWIDWEAKRYTPGKTKGKEAKAIPIPPWLIDHLRALPAYADGNPTHQVIALSRRGWPHRSGFARRVMQAANKECGLKGITPHRLRGTFATMMSKNAPVQDVQEALRHKSVNTTIGYLEKDMGTIVNAQAIMAEKMDLNLRETCERN